MPDFEPRDICLHCRRPVSVCYCRFLRRIETATRIVLLQHPRERDMAIGTARMASLCLPNSHLLVGFDWENSKPLARLLSDPGCPPALLYPGEDSVDLRTAPLAGPITLIVIDGTWANTRKMLKKNPILAQLPRVAFQPERPSEYRIRREPKAECVSTIEALMYVLGALEGGTKRFESLLVPFRQMVDTQLRCKESRGTPRSRYKRPRVPKCPALPAALLENPDRIVCVGGEANAWPCRDLQHRAAYPDELVQWVARRPFTNEGFEGFVTPLHPLSPSTPSHLNLEAATLHAGGKLEALLEQWRSYIREDDVVCSWGRYATALFVESGGYLPESRFDLRLLTKNLLKRNIGTLDEYYASIESSPPEPLASGRAGLRLGQLTRITHHLCNGAMASTVV